MQSVLEKNTLVQYEAKNQGNDKETTNKNKKKKQTNSYLKQVIYAKISSQF